MRTVSVLSVGIFICVACANRDAGVGEHAEPQQDTTKNVRDSDKLLRIGHAMLRDLRVTVQPAESRPANDTVTVLGELRVNEDAYAEVGSPIAARVARVLAAPGDVVVAGQPLVELESPDVGRARASFSSSQARVDLARQTLERRRGLALDKIVPQREMQSAEAELAQTQADNTAAQQTLSALGAARGSGVRFPLASPIDGTIIERAAVRGRMTDSEQRLFSVSDLRRLWLVVHAFERDALRVRAGLNAQVTFPALPGQTFTGPITRIGSRVDPASRTIDVRIEVDNPKGLLRPGMSGSALVPLGDSHDSVIAVMVEALQRQAQGWCVFIPQSQEGVFEIRSVGRGRDLGGEVEILSGLAAGERVVVDGAFLLRAEADKARGSEDEHRH